MAVGEVEETKDVGKDEESDVKASDPVVSVETTDEQDREGESEDDNEREVIVRADPLPQQNASPADIDRGLRLIQACRDGAFQRVQSMIQDGAPAGFTTKTGWTPIAAAACSGDCAIVAHLLEIGADAMYVTHKRHHGSSMQTATDMNVAKQELNGGKKPQGLNTPLHWACYEGHANVVHVLMQAGYSIEDSDPLENRCLHLAASGGHVSVIEILLAHSAAVEPRNRYGNRALDLATDPMCRKLIAKFEQQRQCAWCKDTFSRIRRPSLCQQCHAIFCDVKPCSALVEAAHVLSTSTTGTSCVRMTRFCQECATEMGKAEQELRVLLQSKLDMIQDSLSSITLSGLKARPGDTEETHASVEEAPEETMEGAGRQDEEGDEEASSSEPSGAVETSDSPRTSTQEGNVEAETPAEGSGEGEQSCDEPGDTEHAEESVVKESEDLSRSAPSSEEIFRALTLSQSDAEALHTAMETAQMKNADRKLIEDTRRVYRQLVAHVALQEEIKALMVVRPIGVRSLIDPLLRAYEYAHQAQVNDKLLQLAQHVIQSAEVECTLFGCHALCTKIELGSIKHQRDIARLDASIDEAQSLGVSPQLLEQAQHLRDRLHAEIRLEHNLAPYEVAIEAPNPETNNQETVKYIFPDGWEATTLLQALEQRFERITQAVDEGTAIDGVSVELLEEGNTLLKQLKKEIRDETRNEEERRRLEEEAALKAARKKKKKA